MINQIIEKITLSKEEYNKYARHIILDSIGIPGQQRLKEAKILIVGAGALACPCIIYLATSGIGCLGIIDHDIVSLSNLQRQILYQHQDINKLKSDIAKKKVKSFNSICKIKTYCDKLTNENATDIIRNYDIIIDASDNFTTRYIIDESCYQLHKIHIYGGIQNFYGQISVFNYKNGPRYSDLYPKYLELNNHSCNEGVFNMLPAVIGILQATEAIKIIAGFGNILSGSMIIYNAWNMSFHSKLIRSKRIEIDKRKNYINHERNQSLVLVTEISRISSRDTTFIDVRQKTEFDKGHINNSINIPLKTIKHNYYISLLRKYSKTNTLLIYCSNNSRSIIASGILQKYKIPHYRLLNGLNAWLNR